jgi:hypothetical protein
LGSTLLVFRVHNVKLKSSKSTRPVVPGTLGLRLDARPHFGLLATS